MIFSYFYGVISYKYELPPFYLIKSILNNTVDKKFHPYVGYPKIDSKTPIDCAIFKENTQVILIAGQSNAANSGEIQLGNIKNSYNFNILDNKCYTASDPMLGTTGLGGTIWTHLGLKIQKMNPNLNVLFVPIAVSGSSIYLWQKDINIFYQRIAMVQQGLDQYGIKVNTIFWQQGESDTQMSQKKYYGYLTNVVRSFVTLIKGAKIFIADSTYCQGKHSNAIRKANRQIIQENAQVYTGPDLDQYHDASYRHDDCHLSVKGQEIAADEWFNRLNHIN